MSENIRCTYMRENVCERDTYMHGHVRVCVCVTWDGHHAKGTCVRTY